MHARLVCKRVHGIQSACICSSYVCLPFSKKSLHSDMEKRVSPQKSRAAMACSCVIPETFLVCCLGLCSVLRFGVGFCLFFLFRGGADYVEECLPFKTRPIFAMMLLSFFWKLVVDVSRSQRCWANPNPFVVWVSPCVSSSWTCSSTSTRTPSSTTSPRSPPRLFFCVSSLALVFFRFGKPVVLRCRWCFPVFLLVFLGGVFPVFLLVFVAFLSRNALEEFSSCQVFFFGSFSFLEGSRRRRLCFFLFSERKIRANRTPQFPSHVFVGLFVFPFSVPTALCYRPFWPCVPSFLVFSQGALRILMSLDSLGTSGALSSLVPSEAPFSDARRQGCLRRFSLVVVVFFFFCHVCGCACCTGRPTRL